MNKEPFKFGNVEIRVCPDGDIEFCQENESYYDSGPRDDYIYIPVNKIEDFKKWLNSNT